jgi:hypothetical protein
MPDSGRTAKQILGLVSLVLVPFGVFTFIYSSQVLSDAENMPEEVVNLLAAPVSVLEIANALAASTTFVGMIFLLLYVLDYVKNPDVYAENYSRLSAIFGIVAGLAWIVGVSVYGYLPAASAVAELGAVAQENGTAIENAVEYASEYERAVFRMAIYGGAVVLGLVWWLISLVSWVESPDSTARVLILDGEPYCGSCGAELPDENASQCPECGIKLE